MSASERPPADQAAHQPKKRRKKTAGAYDSSPASITVVTEPDGIIEPPLGDEATATTEMKPPLGLPQSRSETSSEQLQLQQQA